MKKILTLFCSLFILLCACRNDIYVEQRIERFLRQNNLIYLGHAKIANLTYLYVLKKEEVEKRILHNLPQFSQSQSLAIVYHLLQNKIKHSEKEGVSLCLENIYLYNVSIDKDTLIWSYMVYFREGIEPDANPQPPMVILYTGEQIQPILLKDE